MDNDLIARVAFAIQDGSIHRLKAQRIARAAIAAIQNGDELGRGIFAVQRALNTGRDVTPTRLVSWKSKPGEFEIADVSTLKPIGDGSSFECLRRLADATRD